MKIGIKNIRFTGIISLTLLSQFCYSQVNTVTLQAVFLYQSIKYLEWPVDDFESFEILVVGESEIYDELLKITKSRKAGSKSIIVKRTLTLTSLPRCHVLIFTFGSGQFDRITSVVNDSPILVVTANEGLLEKGSDLNFIKKGDKLSIQLNTSALTEKKIKVSSSLSAMAEKVI